MRFLPLGSVVSLTDSPDWIMIYGYLQKDLNTGKVYDYIGCEYPVGIKDTDQCFLFQDENIRKVAYVGFQDAEVLEYQAALAEFAEESGLNGRNKE